MPFEIPAREVLDAKIVVYNGSLLSLSEKARLQGIAPVDATKLPESDESTELRADLSDQYSLREGKIPMGYTP